MQLFLKGVFGGFVCWQSLADCSFGGSGLVDCGNFCTGIVYYFCLKVLVALFLFEIYTVHHHTTGYIVSHKLHRFELSIGVYTVATWNEL